jgi:phenylacetate-CoA ligase
MPNEVHPLATAKNKKMSAPVHPPRDAIEAGQLEQLRGLVTELFPGNRFYTQKLNALGITFDVGSLQDYCQRFPFTTKQELVADQQANPIYGTNLTYPLSQYTRYHQTSGTAGAPLRWLDTPESWQALVQNWLEIFEAAGVTARDRVYFAFSFGPFIGFWLAFEGATRLGCLCIPGGGMSSVARVRALLDNQVNILFCTPTYALRLAEVAREEKLDLKNSKVRKIIVAGEPGGSIPSVRSRVAEQWGSAELFDHHGMTEVGPVTYECPKRPGVLHVIESAYLPEVIDSKTGRAVSMGQEGELVLTTLTRTASPLLRYRTGDIVKGGRGLCVCGRSNMTLEGGILGRTDDMVVIRGVNIYPGAVEKIVRGIEGISEYRVTVTNARTLPEISIEIETGTNNSRHVGEELQKQFEISMSLRVPVQLVPAGTLPRFEMKARRWRIDA